jgi:hypothetical protein
MKDTLVTEASPPHEEEGGEHGPGCDRQRRQREERAEHQRQHHQRPGRSEQGLGQDSAASAAVRGQGVLTSHGNRQPTARAGEPGQADH